MKTTRKHAWTLLFIGLGYLGAAAFYSYLFGINAQTPIACPICPHIDSIEAPIPKFVRRVLVLGTLNAVFFVVVGWLVISLASLIGRNRSHS